MTKFPILAHQSTHLLLLISWYNWRATPTIIRYIDWGNESDVSEFRLSVAWRIGNLITVIIYLLPSPSTPYATVTTKKIWWKNRLTFLFYFTSHLKLIILSQNIYFDDILTVRRYIVFCCNTLSHRMRLIACAFYNIVYAFIPRWKLY